jgi:hypothetical protein
LNSLCDPVHLTSTKLWRGGSCPASGERVGKLYLPHGATHFAGREAHDLTYTQLRRFGVVT